MTRLAFVVFAALLLLAAPASAARIVLDPAAQGDRAYGFAAGELAAASAIGVAYGAESQAGDIVVGGASPAVKALLGSGRLSLPAGIKADGFAIRQLGDLTVVAGADARGDLYGMLWLAERTRLDPKALRSLECVREPAFALREFADGWGHREPPGRGYDGWFQECLRLGINTDSAPLSHDHLRLAKSYHLNVYSGTKPFECLPVADLIAKFGDEVSESPGQLCPLKPKVWEIYREQLREQLRAFPEVDSVLIGVSDFNEEYYVYGCRGPACQTLSDAEAIRLAIQAAWEVVVGEFHKTLLVSGWGNPPDTFALNVPADYRYIMDGLPDGGIVSVHDNTQHDFYLTSPFNPVLGVGDRPQSIMFQVTREYAGQGFIPVYIGPMLRERLARFRETGLAHGARGRLWVGEGLWTRDVLWTRANMYAFFRATWEPEGDPWEWARDWAALTFGPQGAGELAEALCLSEEVARRTFWVHGYSGAKAHAYAITHRNVFTDGTHYFRWDPQPHLAAYRQNQMSGKVEAALAEAEGALALRDRMMGRWRVARGLIRDPGLRDACDRDFEHLSGLADVLNAYQCAMLLWCRTQDDGISTEDRCRAARQCVEYARRTLAAYQRYWARFAQYPDAVFRDSGMTEMLAVYLRDCAALSARPEVMAAQPGEPARVAFSVFNNAAPQGMSAAVALELPDGWRAGPAQEVRLGCGKRTEVAFEVTPPADAPQGDAEIAARLLASGAEIERAAVRVKVIGLSGAVAESAQPARATTICPGAARAPQVDGVMSPGEWAGAAALWANYPLAADQSSEDNAFAVEVRWIWDAAHFYMAWVIGDELLQPVVGRSIHRGDVEGVVFDLDGDRRDDYAIRFVHARDGLIAWPVTVNGTLTSSKFYDRAEVEPLGRDVVLAMGERRDAPGRVVEAAIPWSLLGGFEPAVGKVIGLAVHAGDADSPERTRAFWGWPPPRPERTGPIGSWVRPDKPTDFADLVFTR